MINAYDLELIIKLSWWLWFENFFGVLK